MAIELANHIYRDGEGVPVVLMNAYPWCWCTGSPWTTACGTCARRRSPTSPT